MIPGERSSENELISSILYQLRPFAKKESGERETRHPPTVYMTSGLASHKLAGVNMAHLTQLHKALTGERDERMIKLHSFMSFLGSILRHHTRSRSKACFRR